MTSAEQRGGVNVVKGKEEPQLELVREGQTGSNIVLGGVS